MFKLKFLNYLTKSVKIKLILLNIESLNVENFNIDLLKLVTCSLDLNIEKCGVMHVGSKNPLFYI